MKRMSTCHVGFTSLWTAALVILFLCGSLTAYADTGKLTPLRLDGSTASFPLDDHLAVAEDAEGVLSIADAVRHGGFQDRSQARASAGTQWYRFAVMRTGETPADWVLAFGEPDMDDVRIFVSKADGGFTEIQLGRRIPSRLLPVAARQHVALLTLPEAEPVTVYMRLASLHKIRFQAAALWRPEALLFEEARQSALYGIHFGILVVIVAVYALFGLWLRDGAMLAYSLFVGTILCRGMTHTGIVSLLFPDAGHDTNLLLKGIGFVGGAAAFIVMWDRILDLRKTFPLMHRIYALAGAGMAASLLLAMGPTSPAVIQVAQIAMLVVSLGSLVMAAILVYRDPKAVLTTFYLCAFFPIALVWAIKIAALLSPAIPPDLGRRVDVVAIMAHIAILSAALAYRLRQMQQERTRAEVALAGERLARQRLRNFFDMATHEFKTPLSVIDSAAQVLGLLIVPARPDVDSRLAAIRRSVQRLVKLIETCLAGERDQTMTANLRPIVPGGLVTQVVERNRDPDGAPVRVAPCDPPNSCLADPDLLGIALDALIDNARRYGPKEQVVEIAVQGNDTYVSFIVQDRGPGIPADEAPCIFEKFYRGSSSASLPGTGVGLHLVKVIAGLHGGQVSYRPRDGGGACFVLSIPTGPPSARHHHVLEDQVSD